MSVYIKVMKMPETCDECALKSAWCIWSLYTPLYKSNKRADECPLVPVPPHGDLIDRDALKAKQQEDADLFKRSASYGDRCRRDEAMNAVANIVNAPTIIPAEEDET